MGTPSVSIYGLFSIISKVYQWYFPNFYISYIFYLYIKYIHTH
nr:MAG TPA: hypothetical protein [Caudoviricetes sp.]